MNDEMIKFYEDRIKHLETMLEKSMEMNKKLMDKIAERPITSLPYPLPTQPTWTSPWPTPTWSEPYTYKCPQCGISGINGYVCTNTACPTKVTCESKTN